MLIYSSIFAYFVLNEDTQCYARDESAFSISYDNTEDVTRQWYILSIAGTAILVTASLLYLLHAIEGFD